ASRRFHFDAADAGTLTMTVKAAGTLAYLFAGWMGDRHGNRAVLQVSTLAGGAAVAAAWGAPRPGWGHAGLGLDEPAGQGRAICAMNYVLELCPPERSSTYTAVYGLATGPFRVFLPLLGGMVIRACGYGPLFGAALVGGLGTFALLLARVPEPRHAAVTHPF